MGRPPASKSQEVTDGKLKSNLVWPNFMCEICSEFTNKTGILEFTVAIYPIKFLQFGINENKTIK